MSLFPVMKIFKTAKLAVFVAGILVCLVTPAFAQPAQARGSDFQKIVDIIESNASPRTVRERGGLHVVVDYHTYVLKTSNKGKFITYNLKKVPIEQWSLSTKDVEPRPTFNNRGTLVRYVLNIEYGSSRNKVSLTDKGVDGSIEQGSMGSGEYTECRNILFKKYKVRESRLKSVHEKDSRFLRKKAAYKERSRKRMNSMPGYNRNNYNRAPIPFKPRTGPNKVWRSSSDKK